MKKNVKMNLTLSKEFHKFLKQRATEEHLAVSTYVKKYLMDQMKNNWMEYKLTK